MKPVENGIMSICIFEDVFARQFTTILKVLKGVLYGKMLDQKTPGYTSINIYIASKQLAFNVISYRKMIDEYLEELLSVDLPSFDIVDAEEDSLIVSSVCMSVESIKLIHELMQGHFDYIKLHKESFSKYVARVQFFISNQETSTNPNDIFKPTEKSFQAETGDGLPPPTKEEFESAYHYVLFQDISVKSGKNTDMQLEKWQSCITKLLSEIDLSSYYNNQIRDKTSSKPAQQSKLTKLLYQIFKCPEGFISDQDNGVKIKLMAYYLINYFEAQGEENARNDLETLKTIYDEGVKLILDKHQRVEQNLRLTLTALTNRDSCLKTQIVRYNNDVVNNILAGRFVTTYRYPYEITKISAAASPPKRLGDKKYASFIVEKTTIDSKYLLVFPAPTKKPSKRNSPQFIKIAAKPALKGVVAAPPVQSLME